MTGQTLDEWFAAADDVLTDWQGDTDAMRCEPSKGEQDVTAADSYYDQAEPWPDQPGEVVYTYALSTDRYMAAIEDVRAQLDRTIERVSPRGYGDPWGRFRAQIIA